MLRMLKPHPRAHHCRIRKSPWTKAPQKAQIRTRKPVIYIYVNICVYICIFLIYIYIHLSNVSSVDLHGKRLRWKREEASRMSTRRSVQSNVPWWFHLVAT